MNWRHALIDIRDFAGCEEAQAAPYVTLEKIHNIAKAALSGEEENMEETCAGCIWLAVDKAATEKGDEPSWTCKVDPGNFILRHSGTPRCKRYQAGGNTLDLRSDPAVPEGEALVVGPSGDPAGKITDLDEGAGGLCCQRATGGLCAEHKAEVEDKLEQAKAQDYPMAVLAGLNDTVRALKQRVAVLEEQMGDRAQDDRIIGQQMARIEKRLGMPTPHIPQPTPMLETVVLIAATFSFEAWHRWPGAPKLHDYLGSRHRHLFRVKAWLPVKHDDRDVEFIEFGRKLRQWCEQRANEERRVHEGLEAAGSCTVQVDSETGASKQTDSWENPGVEIGTWSCERWCRELVREFDLAGVEVAEDGENGAVLLRPGCFHASR